ncbi:MAG: ATP-dependent DNA ligase [Acidimicrobiaceae bacterium]|nr:ATP-dependent DNA ligase [Acidimicrobiaceae bacterium]MYF42685.1 ATP-dependent DNA ligase [Acidimicrobiaceae bacterium]MYJ36499.1 ATP-dependent DNA ligase [Acidimicrobiaceae bacterium]
MLLADLVACADAVAATSARTEKIEFLTGLLQGADGREAGVVAGLIAGDPRQGRIGVGWATVAALQTDSAAEPTLSVADLDAMLDEVAGAAGGGSTQRRLDLLEDFLARATAAEADFVRRLLVGELRQGASEGVVVEAVARAAGVAASVVRRALMLVGDLGETAGIALKQGAPGLEAVRFEVLRPIRPMLASTADDAASAVAELGRCSVEWKLDGIRIQVHRRGEEVRIWTRNLNDVTDRLGEVADLVRSLPVKVAALDGEVLGLADDLAPAAFQDTMGRVGTRGTGESASPRSETVRVRPMFFDALHLEGRDLLDEPLEVRLGCLAEAAADHRVPGVVTADPDEAEQVFAAAVGAGHEGVMVKAAGSPYAAGRRGKAWRKVKPVHSFDLVVLAVEPGSGRRRGWLSNVHLGARDPSGGFVMVGKTFKGMTDEMLRWQTRRFDELATDRRAHVVKLRPEQVVEIAVDGVQRSSRYPGGVALRFARVVRYRSDKSAAEADTIDAVRSLLSSPAGSVGSAS